MDNLKFYVSEEVVGKRIDKWLSENVEELSRALIQKLIDNNDITINDLPVNKNYKLKLNDLVKIAIPDPVELDILPQDIPIDIVYEDDDLLVVNKPKGMVVHPAAGNFDKTLVNALLFHCEGRLSSINGVIRPGIVHRIDKNTSGLLIVAKNDNSHNFLAEQIKNHTFTREYQAIVCGKFKEDSGTIDEPIGRDRKDRKKMCVTYENSRNAVTHYTLIENFKKHALVSYRLETGRTHQIRVHSAFIGHPVLGDNVYGKELRWIDGQCLHAKKIGFIHPTTNEYMEFDSELPEYFLNAIKRVR